MDSFTLKTDRAYEHFQSFQEEARAWVKAKPYGLTDEPDTEAPLKPLKDGVKARRWRITRVEPIPERLSIILGDCLFNLRSALDHIVFALAFKKTPGMIGKELNKPEFPVIEDPLKFPEAQKSRLGFVDPTAYPVIEAFQPYQRTDRIVTNDPLWQIHELNRIDKHRRLTICGARLRKTGGRNIVDVPADTFPNWFGGYSYWVPSAEIAFKLNTIWARWAPLTKDANQEMTMDLDVPVEIVFDQGAPFDFKPVIPTLQTLCDFVRADVIPKLSKFL